MLALAGNSRKVTLAKSRNDDDNTRDHDCETSRKNNEKLNWPGKGAQVLEQQPSRVDDQALKG